MKPALLQSKIRIRLIIAAMLVVAGFTVITVPS